MLLEKSELKSDDLLYNLGRNSILKLCIWRGGSAQFECIVTQATGPIQTSNVLLGAPVIFIYLSNRFGRGIIKLLLATAVCDGWYVS